MNTCSAWARERKRKIHGRKTDGRRSSESTEQVFFFFFFGGKMMSQEMREACNSAVRGGLRGNCEGSWRDVVGVCWGVGAK